MADELSIQLGVELDMDSVKSQLEELKGNKNNNIKLQLDKLINTQIGSLRKNLDQLSSKVYPIKIQIDQSAISNIQSITDALNKAVTNVQNNISRTNSGLGSANYNASRTGVAKVTQFGKIVTDQNSPMFGRFEATSEIEKQNLALGERLTIYKQLKKEEGDEIGYLEETSRQYETNYEEQAKAREKALKDEQKLQDDYTKLFIQARQKQAKEDEKLSREEQKRQSDYDKLFAEAERKRAKQETDAKKASEQSYISSLKENSKQLEYEQKAMANAQSLISNAQNDLNLLEKSTFSGSKALTGDYAERARTEIQTVRDELEALKESAGKSFSDALGISKEGLSASLKNLSSELGKLKDLEYPADKLAAKDVDTLKLDYGNKIQEFRDQLKEAGLESSEFTTRLDSLGESLKTVGVVDGSGTVWAEWKGQFESLQAEFNKFQTSASGMGQKLAESIGGSQLEQVQKLSETLNSLPEDLSGAGVAALKEELSSIASSYQELMGQLQSGNLTQDQFTDLSNQAKELDDRLKQVSSAAKIFNDGFKNEQDIEKYRLNVENLTDRFERLKQKYQEFVQANPNKANAGIEQSIQQFEQSLNNVDPTVIGILNKEFRNLNTEVNNAINPTQSLASILQNSFGGIGQYLSRFVSVTFLITKAVQAIKSMEAEVQALDTSMVELQKVTNLTGNALSNFVDKAYDIGKGLGRTGKDVVDAVTTFSRAGYDLNEATNLAQTALVMSNIGPDIASTEDAASDMISILKAYDKQAEESMDVIDKLYNVANTQPLDFGNITEMLVTAGGTLAQTGTSIEQTIGLLTGAFATLRNTSVSNGLLMISQRLRAVDEDGQAIDGLMPKLEDDFKLFGSSIQDENGNLRTTYELLSDLHDAWDTLSSKQRQMIGEDVAGNRQVKTLNAIMANWDTVQSAIAAADNAAGTAMEGNAMYMDSIEGRITQLQSAFQNLARTTIDSGFVKGLVSFGTTVLNIVTNLGGLVPVLTTILGLIVAIKSVQIGEAITKAWMAISGLISGIGSAATLTSGWVGILIALAGILITVANATGIFGDNLKKLEQASSDAKQKYADQQSALKDLNGELENTKSLIAELEGKDSLTVVEEDELSNLKARNAELEREIILQNELARISEREAREAAVKTITAKNKSTKDKEQKTRNGISEGLIDTLGTSYLSNVQFSSGYKVNPNEYKGQIMIPSAGMVTTEELANLYMDALPKQIQKYEQYSKALSIYKRTMQQEGEYTEEAAKQAEDNVAAWQGYVQESQDWLANYYNYLDKQTEGIHYVENAAAGSIDEQYNQLLELKDRVGEAINSSYVLSQDKQGQSDYILGLNRLKEQVEGVKKTVEETGDISLEDLRGQFPELIAEFEKYGWKAEEVARHLKEINAIEPDTGEVSSITKSSDLTASLYSATEAYKTLTAAMQEQQKAGVLSAETWNKLINSEDEGLAGIAQYLELTANGYVLNTEAVYDYIKAQNDNQKVKALQGIQDQAEALEELREKAKTLSGDDLQINIDQQNEAQAEIDRFSALIREIDSATDALARYNVAKSTLNQDAEFNEGQKAYETFKEAWEIGKVGTDDFKESMNYLIGDDWKKRYKDIEAAGEAASKIGERYLGQKDERTGLQNFMQDLSNLQIDGQQVAAFDAATGTFEMLSKVDGTEFTFDEIADSLGVSEALIRSMFGLAEAYGAEFEFPEIITEKDVELMKNLNAKEAAETLAQVEEHAQGLQEKLESTDPNSEEYAQIQEELENCDKAAQVLQETIDNTELDTSAMSLDEALAKIQELQTAIDVLKELGLPIPVTLTEQYEECNELIQELKSGTIEGEATINAGGDGAETIDKAKENLGEVNKGADATINADDNGTIEAIKTDISGIEDTDHNTDFTIGLDATSESAFAQKLNDYEKTRTITYEVEVTGDEDGYVDNTNPLPGGGVSGYSGVMPYEQNTGVQLPSKDELSALHNQLNFLNSIDRSELSTDNLAKLDSDIANIQSQIDQVTSNQESEAKAADKRASEYGYDENGTPPVQPWQEEPQPTGKVEGTEGGPAMPDEVFEHLDSVNIESDGVEIQNEGAGTGEQPPKEGTEKWPWEPYEGSFPEQPTEEVEIETKPDGKKSWGEYWKDAWDEAEPVDVEANVETEEVVEEVEESVEESDPTVSVSADESSLEGITAGVEDAIPEEETVNVEENVSQNVNTSYSGDTNGPNVQEVTIPTSLDTSGAEADNSALRGKIEQTATKPVTANTSAALISNVNLEKVLSRPVEKTVTIKNVGGVTQGPYAKGTKNALGGLSLVDDGVGANAGPELIEHIKQGTFELGTGDGPRLTTLDKGDVVHTAKETSKILARLGKIGGFFRDGLNKGKSIIGNAFATGISGKMSWSLINKTLKSAQGRNSGRSNSSTAGVINDAEDFKNWAEKLFDWAEIRLDRLKTVTSTWLQQASNAVGYIAKNAKLSSAIKSVEKEIENTSAAYELYLRTADDVAKRAGLGDDIVQRIKDGSIEISEYDEDMREKISQYQTWYDKAMDCVEALSDLREQEKEIATQRIDNVIDYYNNRIGLNDQAVRIRNAQIDLLEAQGQSYSAKAYDKPIRETNTKLSRLTKERQKVSEELNRALSEGLIEKESDEWYKYQNTLLSLDEQIITTQKDLVELKKSAREIKLTNLGYSFDSITNKASELSDELALRSAKGLQIFGSSYSKMIKNAQKGIANLTKQNEYLTKLQAGMDVNSAEYQRLEGEKRSNRSQINAYNVDIEGYQDQRNELTLQRLGWRNDRLTNQAEKITDRIAMRQAKGLAETTKPYKELIDNGNQQITNLELQNAQLREMRIGLDVNSEKYQEITNRIRDNDKAIQSVEQSQIDWNKRIQEIPIERLGYALDKLNAYADKQNDIIELREATGRTENADYYNKLIANANKENTVLEKQIALWKEQQSGMDTNSAAYQELEGKIRNNENAIRDNNKSVVEWTDSINKIPLTKLGYQLDRLTSRGDVFKGMMDLHTAQGIEETSSAYRTLILNSMNQNEVLEEENRQLMKLQEGLDKTSTKYQEYEKQIQSNNKAILQNKISQEEWNDAIVDLKVDKIEKYRDSISKTNDQLEKQKNLQEALLELEKARSQRTQRVYVEGEGFVYQADQDAIKEAQTNVESLLRDQMLDKLDDIIDALEAEKGDTNIYDKNGNLIGEEYTLPNISNLTKILSDYYNDLSNINVSSVSGLKKALQSNVSSSSSNATSFNIGDIYVQEANNASSLADAIVTQLPNALLQALYKK